MMTESQRLALRLWEVNELMQRRDDQLPPDGLPSDDDQLIMAALRCYADWLLDRLPACEPPPTAGQLKYQAIVDRLISEQQGNGAA